MGAYRPHMPRSKPCRPSRHRVARLVDAILYIVADRLSVADAAEGLSSVHDVCQGYYLRLARQRLFGDHFELLLQTRKRRAGRRAHLPCLAVNNRQYHRKRWNRAVRRARRSRAVSAVCHEHSPDQEVWTVQDSGWPLEVGNQVQASNSCKLRRQERPLLSLRKVGRDFAVGSERGDRKRTVDDVSKLLR